nr:unnamed protein product [Digitaria exilis]
MCSTGATATADDLRRVLLFPLPYQGHINPMFQLAGVLHSRGFAITVFHTHFNAPDASRHPDYHFVPVPRDGGMPTLAGDSSLDTAISQLVKVQPQGSVLYVSFGSLASMSSSDFAETAWGIAGSGRHFLWVLRPGLVPDGGAGEPPPLPDGFDAAAGGRCVVVRWAPQEEVLAHAAVGAFWTHCGWNSTVEAACVGVPMLCSSCFGNQMGNARYVVDVWRNSLMLAGGKIERGKVAAAVVAT